MREDRYLDQRTNGTSGTNGRPAGRRRAIIAICIFCVCAAAVLFWIGRSMFGEVLSGLKNSVSSSALAAAVYPEEVQYPGEDDDDAWEEWWQQVRAKRALSVDTDGLAEFFGDSTRVFLVDAVGDSGGGNAVYSPLNLYFALCILAESTDGETRAQILSVLGVSDLETLRTQAGTLWNRNYQDDGYATCIFANSVWLSDAYTYQQDTLDTIAANYYASLFSGSMGSDSYNQLLQDWINEQTGDLLEEQTDGLQMNTETVLQIVSTNLFESSWQNYFNVSNDTTGIFYGVENEAGVTFMNRTDSGSLYSGEHFTAVCLDLNNDGGMWFLLPAADSDLQTVISSDLDALISYSMGEDEGGLEENYYEIHLSIPKFDVTTNLDLAEGLVSLGITDAFSADTADFSALVDTAGDGNDSIFVSEVLQAARVMIDEEGVTAASYTVITADASAAGSNQEIYFTVDQPFLFMITGACGEPLYIGIVNQL